MLQNDNWGSVARIGMFIVSSEAVPESEWWAMMPQNVSVHIARISAPAPWANWRKDRKAVQLADDLERGCRQFSDMRLSALVIGHSSSSFIGGIGWDEAVVENITGILNGDTHVTTNGLDTLAALRASEVWHPYLVLPPWFNMETVLAGVRYFRDKGFEPVGHLQYDPGPNWRNIAPGDLYKQGMGFSQEVEPLYTQIKASCPPEADGVLIAGTGFRCVAILDSLERDIKRPVLSANQISLWHCLRLSGVRSKVLGYGKLLY